MTLQVLRATVPIVGAVSPDPVMTAFIALARESEAMADRLLDWLEEHARRLGVTMGKVA